MLDSTPQAQDSTELRAPSAFAGITDSQARSRALFTEAAKVIINPRCMNCHPATDRPTQGNDMHARSGPPRYGAGSCQTCHTDRALHSYGACIGSKLSGHPRWDVAPIEMAWQGKSAGEICQQIKGTKRNGGRSLEYFTITWPKMISSPGRGIPALGATRSPARRRDWANWCGPGSIAARPVRKPSIHSAVGRS